MSDSQADLTKMLLSNSLSNALARSASPRKSLTFNAVISAPGSGASTPVEQTVEDVELTRKKEQARLAGFERISRRLCKRPAYAGRSNEVVFVDPGHDLEIWPTAMIVPTVELEEQLVERPKVNYTVVRYFHDFSYALVQIKDLFLVNREQEPMFSFTRRSDYAFNRGIQLALAYIEHGALPEGFRWQNWGMAASNSSDMDMVMRTNPDGAATPLVITTMDSDGNEKPLTREQMLKELYAFMESRDQPISKLPSLGYQELDLFKLYCLVIQRGGMDEVTKNQAWKAVYQDLGIPTMSTSASYNTRTNYKKYLYLYELETFEPTTRTIRTLGSIHHAKPKEEDHNGEQFKFRVNDFVRIQATAADAIAFYGQIIKRRIQNHQVQYYVHYNGWSSSHDEWIPEQHTFQLTAVEAIAPRNLSNPSPSRSSKSNHIIDGQIMKFQMMQESSPAGSASSSPRRSRKLLANSSGDDSTAARRINTNVVTNSTTTVDELITAAAAALLTSERSMGRPMPRIDSKPPVSATSQTVETPLTSPTFISKSELPHFTGDEVFTPGYVDPLVGADGRRRRMGTSTVHSPAQPGTPIQSSRYLDFVGNTPGSVVTAAAARLVATALQKTPSKDTFTTPEKAAGATLYATPVSQRKGPYRQLDFSRSPDKVLSSSEDERSLEQIQSSIATLEDQLNSLRQKYNEQVHILHSLQKKQKTRPSTSTESSPETKATNHSPDMETLRRHNAAHTLAAYQSASNEMERNHKSTDADSDEDEDFERSNQVPIVRGRGRPRGSGRGRGRPRGRPPKSSRGLFVQ